MSVAAGVANDTTNVSLMSLAAFSKNTASWFVGSTNGGLDTGAIANSTWYHFYVIKRVDTGAVDVVFSLSATAPNLAAAGLVPYTLFRRIGSMKTDGSAHWLSFTQTGDTFIWGHRSNRCRERQPCGIQSDANCSDWNRRHRIDAHLHNSRRDELDHSHVTTGKRSISKYGSSDLVQSSSGTSAAGDIQRITNTSAQIRQRANNNAVGFSSDTYGWIDTRGK